jgi:hypothetical protein
MEMKVMVDWSFLGDVVGYVKELRRQLHSKMIGLLVDNVPSRAIIFIFI